MLLLCKKKTRLLIQKLAGTDPRRILSCIFLLLTIFNNESWTFFLKSSLAPSYSYDSRSGPIIFLMSIGCCSMKLGHQCWVHIYLQLLCFLDELLHLLVHSSLLYLFLLIRFKVYSIRYHNSYTSLFSSSISLGALHLSWNSHICP